MVGAACLSLVKQSKRATTHWGAEVAISLEPPDLSSAPSCGPRRSPKISPLDPQVLLFAVDATVERRGVGIALFRRVRAWAAERHVPLYVLSAEPRSDSANWCAASAPDSQKAQPPGQTPSP